ncbi:MAG TPA: hydroxysqualene dehydroxylase HpnE [Zeimonas sp.]|nr:hydroxysqualene dehydroxylase HpnE [Zeimonas sp.]
MADLDLRGAALRGDTVNTLAVVGAGWAGLSTAVHAARAGLRVHLVERAPFGGGRAREARIDFGAGPVAVDAGQHLLMGAYRECLRLAAIAHGAAAPPLRRTALALRDTAGLRLEARARRAPWHLLGALAGARGLSLRERWAALRLVAALRARGWRTPAGETVSALLARHRQPRTLVERLWSPLCIGAMNTAPESACAGAFAAVLRDTLGAERAASDFVLPETTLDAAITRPALGWLRAHGGAVSFGTNVRAVRRAGPHWRIETAGATLEASQLVVATPPADAARLLEPLDPRAQALARFTYEPIATVLLEWPRDALLPLPDWTLLHDDGRRAWGQWLFDRGCIGAHRIAAVVVSAASRLGATTREALGEAVAHQVARQLELPLPRAHRTVIERRATIRCTPDRPRIACDAFADALPGLWLAGDYVDDEYPATLETAVRSGRRAAERVRAAQPQAASSA